ncbi:peptidoglycan-binding domain-containing protein [Streptomyces sp. NPDC049577]|uniref:peptidoglycan-binding domain-containing protein n=1 Tax=Streptomyces sp. NPDC049577 TaxID=3155153 RepID=UPI00341A7E61
MPRTRSSATAALLAALSLCTVATGVAAARPAPPARTVCGSGAWDPQGKDIARIQCELTVALTDYHGPVDGVLGPRTRQAVREFQFCDGLPVTGSPAGTTRSELHRVYLTGVPIC